MAQHVLALCLVALCRGSLAWNIHFPADADSYLLPQERVERIYERIEPPEEFFDCDDDSPSTLDATVNNQVLDAQLRAAVNDWQNAAIASLSAQDSLFRSNIALIEARFHHAFDAKGDKQYTYIPVDIEVETVEAARLNASQKLSVLDAADKTLDAKLRDIVMADTEFFMDKVHVYLHDALSGDTAATQTTTATIINDLVKQLQKMVNESTVFYKAMQFSQMTVENSFASQNHRAIEQFKQARAAIDERNQQFKRYECACQLKHTCQALKDAVTQEIDNKVQYVQNEYAALAAKARIDAVVNFAKQCIENGTAPSNWQPGEDIDSRDSGPVTKSFTLHTSKLQLPRSPFFERKAAGAPHPVLSMAQPQQHDKQPTLGIYNQPSPVANKAKQSGGLKRRSSFTSLDSTVLYYLRDATAVDSNAPDRMDESSSELDLPGDSIFVLDIGELNPTSFHLKQSLIEPWSAAMRSDFCSDFQRIFRQAQDEAKQAETALSRFDHELVAARNAYVHEVLHLESMNKDAYIRAQSALDALMNDNDAAAVIISVDIDAQLDTCRDKRVALAKAQLDCTNAQVHLQTIKARLRAIEFAEHYATRIFSDGDLRTLCNQIVSKVLGDSRDLSASAQLARQTVESLSTRVIVADSHLAEKQAELQRAVSAMSKLQTVQAVPGLVDALESSCTLALSCWSVVRRTASSLDLREQMLSRHKFDGSVMLEFGNTDTITASQSADEKRRPSNMSVLATAALRYTEAYAAHQAAHDAYTEAQALQTDAKIECDVLQGRVNALNAFAQYDNVASLFNSSSRNTA